MTAALVLLATAIAAGGCGEDGSAQPRATGVRSVFTGMPLGPRSDPAGRDIVAAEQMAISERGGRAGRFRIRLVVRPTADAAGMPSQQLSVRAAREAARSDNSLAFIGSYTSGETAATAPILNRAGLVQITPTSTATPLTAVVRGTARPTPQIAPTGLRTLVRLAPSDAIQARATVAYMTEEAVKSIAIADDGGLYGKGLADGVSRDAREAGIRVLGRVGFHDRSPESAAGDLAALRPDAVFIAANSSPDALAFARNLVRTDPAVRVFLPDGLSERPTLEALGEAQDRAYVTNFVLPVGYYGPRGVRFVDRFRDRYRRDPSPFALYGYEAMSLVLDAVAALPEDAGLGLQGERDFVAHRVLATRDRAAVIGSYSVTSTGDVSTDLYGAFRVENGRLVRGRAVTVGRTR